MKSRVNLHGTVNLQEQAPLDLHFDYKKRGEASKKSYNDFLDSPSNIIMKLTFSHIKN